MQQLTNILERATQAVLPEYFQLPIFGGDDVFRERVYCYELYHQMRLLWPNPTDFRLNGEIDKQGHRRLAELGVLNDKPDFLVHVPRSMDHNYAIVEVKPVTATDAKIRIDLRKLSRFVSDVGYERGIYLFYGFADELAERVRTIARIDNIADIEIWHHAEVGQSARLVAEI